MSLLKHLLLSHRYREQTRVNPKWVLLVLAAATVATVLFAWSVW